MGLEEAELEAFIAQHLAEHDAELEAAVVRRLAGHVADGADGEGPPPTEHSSKSRHLMEFV